MSTPNLGCNNARNHQFFTKCHFVDVCVRCGVVCYFLLLEMIAHGHKSCPIQMNDNNIDAINIAIKIEFNSQSNHTVKIVDNDKMD